MTVQQPLFEYFITQKISLQKLIIFCSCIAILVGCKVPTQNHFDPFLLLFVPAWVLMMFSDMYRFLRKPRTLDFSFVCAIPYKQRQMFATMYVKSRLRYLGYSVLSIALCFLSTRFILCGKNNINDTVSILSSLIAEYGASILFFILLIQCNLFKPIQHDTSIVTLPKIGSPEFYTTVKKSFSDWFWNLSGTGTYFAKGHGKILLRRQWLYLFRYDWFTFFFLQGAGLLIACTVVCFVTRENSLITTISLLFIPSMLFLQNYESISVSTERFYCCPYYNLTDKTLLSANIILCSVLMAPYVVFYVISILLMNSPPGFFSILSFLFCACSIILVFAARFSKQNKNQTAVIYHMITTFLCVFIASVCASYDISVTALVFSLLPILFTVILL